MTESLLAPVRRIARIASIARSAGRVVVIAMIAASLTAAVIVQGTVAQSPPSLVNPRLIAVLHNPKYRVMNVAFSPDGAMIATIDLANAVYLWSVRTRHRVATILPPVRLGCERQRLQCWVGFSPDGTLLATADPVRGLRLWDVATRRQVATLSPAFYYTEADLAAAFSPDGATIAFPMLTRNGNNGDQVWLWDIGTRSRVATLTLPHNDEALTVRFSPDGRYLAVGGAKTYLWDVHARRLVATLDAEGDVTPAFSPDSRMLLTIGNREQFFSQRYPVLLWNVATHRIITSWHERIPADADDYITDLAFGPDGTTIMAFDQALTFNPTETVCPAELWDISMPGTAAPIFTAPRQWCATDPNSITFSPDGTLIAISQYRSASVLLSEIGGNMTSRAR